MANSDVGTCATTPEVTRHSCWLQHVLYDTDLDVRDPTHIRRSHKPSKVANDATSKSDNARVPSALRGDRYVSAVTRAAFLSALTSDAARKSSTSALVCRDLEASPAGMVFIDACCMKSRQ